MCGRYTLEPEEIAKIILRFNAQYAGHEYHPRWNIAPSDRVPVIINDGEANVVHYMNWAYRPHWGKPAMKAVINARAEGIQTKPYFRDSFKQRRCLIPASSFYEWSPQGTTKTPYRISLVSDSLFAMAGVYDEWQSARGAPVTGFAIITTDANKLVAQLHNRMPVILDAGDEARWLDPTTSDSASLQALLRPYPAEQMRYFPVSARVNSPRNDSPDLIEPLPKPNGSP